jgi:predicted aldo/keto reductase-like oxidoreductase
MGRNLETGLFDSCLVWYNCAELEPEEMVFPVAEKQDAGVAIMKATGWGRMLEPPPDWTGEVPTAVDLCRFVLSNPAADVLLYQPTEENEIVGLVRAVEDSQPSSEEETQWLKEYGRAVRKTGRLDG